MRPRTLVIDDCLTVRMDLRCILTDAGFQVFVAGTRAAAWAALRSGTFALAIVDVLLPDGCGIDLIKEMKCVPELARVATILLTTESDVRMRIRGLACGADRYVGKPYDPAYITQVACKLCHLPTGCEGQAGWHLLSGRKVLLIDDDPLLGAAMSARLRSDGGELVAARTADEALTLLDLEPFSCIVVGLTSAGHDGVDTLRRLRRLPYGQDARVLALTGSDEQAAGQRALSAGADEVAPRTPIIDVLRLRLSRMLIKKGGTLGCSLQEPAPTEAL